MGDTIDPPGMRPVLMLVGGRTEPSLLKYTFVTIDFEGNLDVCVLNSVFLAPYDTVADKLKDASLPNGTLCVDDDSRTYHVHSSGVFTLSSASSDTIETNLQALAFAHCILA